MNVSPIGIISVQELSQKLRVPHCQLIDVREPEELELARLPGFQNFPTSQFATWYPTIAQTLDRHQETLVLCHHGIRSAQVCEVLVHLGFTNVKNIQGGIHAYALEIDPSVGKY
ncbi:MAG: rhodanese-related sulfurtransferase [Cyanobacteria bacterium M5B4]|nr:MAG: rhodanese-related sulfurtransferase [Cyanobacteria bacterium M5B4]